MLKGPPGSGNVKTGKRKGGMETRIHTRKERKIAVYLSRDLVRVRGLGFSFCCTNSCLREINRTKHVKK